MRASQLQTNQHLQAAAVAQRTKADVRLAYTEVQAPIDGIVDVRAARAGEVVDPGQPIVTLINPDDLWVRADVEESYIDRIRLGDQLTVRLPSGAEARRARCSIAAWTPAYATQRDVSRTKRDIKTFEIRLAVRQPGPRASPSGMTAYVMLPAPERDHANARHRRSEHRQEVRRLHRRERHSASTSKQGRSSACSARTARASRRSSGC